VKRTVRASADRRERLWTWAAAIAILAIGVTGVALLAAVRHPKVSADGHVERPPGSGSILAAPEAAPGPPTVELKREPVRAPAAVPAH
jgi:hypothetical protein